MTKQDSGLNMEAPGVERLGLASVADDLYQRKVDGDIAAGVAAVMDAVEKVERREENQHGGYKFASVDSIYAAVRRLMAGQRLSLRVDIIEHKAEARTGSRGQQVLWGTWLAKVGLACELGAERPVTRHLQMLITGPQSFEAAVSYLAKQYLRQRFMLETGEGDADEAAPSIPASDSAGPDSNIEPVKVSV